jgi:uncharacterized protein YndB with AHSA1/START domain
MPDIFHNFTINTSPDKVFNGVSTTKGLDNWWTKTCQASPKAGGIYTLDFGPGYTWKAIVTKFEANREFELQMTEADPDWLKARVGFLLRDKGNNLTEVDFYHKGWPTANEHYKISCYCWAMYLRILKRYLEFGEQVPYEKRLSV